MIKKEDFELWLSQPITIAYLEEVKRKDEQVMYQLRENIGGDGPSNEYLQGYLKALQDIQNISVEEVNVD